MASQPPRAPARKEDHPVIQENTITKKQKPNPKRKNRRQHRQPKIPRQDRQRKSPRQDRQRKSPQKKFPDTISQQIPVLVSNQLLYNYAQYTGFPFIALGQAQMQAPAQQPPPVWFYPHPPVMQPPMQQPLFNPVPYSNFSSEAPSTPTSCDTASTQSTVPSEHSTASSVSVPSIPIQGILGDTKFELPAHVQTIIPNVRGMGL